MNIHRGEVVVVDFSATYQSANRRPALVVQNDRDNARMDRTIVVQITTNISRAYEDTGLVQFATKLRDAVVGWTVLSDTVATTDKTVRPTDLCYRVLNQAITGLLEHYSRFIAIGCTLSSTPRVALDIYSLRIRRIVKLHIEELLCNWIFEFDFITIRGDIATRPLAAAYGQPRAQGSQLRSSAIDRHLT